MYTVILTFTFSEQVTLCALKLIAIVIDLAKAYYTFAKKRFPAWEIPALKNPKKTFLFFGFLYFSSFYILSFILFLHHI